MTEPINNIISPWIPESDPHLLATLGKLAEESSELAARAARCIIHGISETDPDTGRTNHRELYREIADVLACVDLLLERPEIAAPPTMFKSRIKDKLEGFRRWHWLIDEQEVLTHD